MSKPSATATSAQSFSSANAASRKPRSSGSRCRFTSRHAADPVARLHDQDRHFVPEPAARGDAGRTRADHDHIDGLAWRLATSELIQSIVAGAFRRR